MNNFSPNYKNTVQIALFPNKEKMKILDEFKNNTYFNSFEDVAIDEMLINFILITYEYFKFPKLCRTQLNKCTTSKLCQYADKATQKNKDAAYCFAGMAFMQFIIDYTQNFEDVKAAGIISKNKFFNLIGLSI